MILSFDLHNHKIPKKLTGCLSYLSSEVTNTMTQATYQRKHLIRPAQAELLTARRHHPASAFFLLTLMSIVGWVQLCKMAAKGASTTCHVHVKESGAITLVWRFFQKSNSRVESRHQQNYHPDLRRLSQDSNCHWFILETFPFQKAWPLAQMSTNSAAINSPYSNTSSQEGDRPASKCSKWLP